MKNENIVILLFYKPLINNQNINLIFNLFLKLLENTTIVQQ